MDGLRLVLLVVGALIVAGIWWWSRRAAPPADAPGPRTEPKLGPSMDDGAERDAAHADDPEPHELTTPALARQRPIDPEDVTQLPERVWESAAEPELDPIPDADGGAHEAPAFDPATQMLLAMMVVPAPGERFLGDDVIAVLEEAKLRFGARRIYHRFDDRGASVWSVAHMLEPGHLDPAALRGDYVHGLVLFAVIPGPRPGNDVFADMLATARRVAQRLHGDLADGERSSLTPQTVQHLREKVLEFERRHAGAGG